MDRVKDYLGYKDLPEFLPIFNKDAPRSEGSDFPGQWEKKSIYEARKLYHNWEEPTELTREAFNWQIGRAHV